MMRISLLLCIFTVGFIGYKIFKILNAELNEENEGNEEVKENDQPISDLIAQLQNLKDMHGDVPVHVLYRNEGGSHWGFYTHKFEYPVFDDVTNAVYI